MYDAINRIMTRKPVISMDKRKSLDIEEVFVQDSSDTVIMAWNLIDWI